MKLPVDYTKLTRGERRLVREEYIIQQQGKCYWCQNRLWMLPTDEVLQAWINSDIFPKGFLNYPVHLQHNHDTGMTEGAVHARCNAVMWQYHNR